MSAKNGINMLGVLPKSQGIANKKDDLAKREVIFCLL